MNLRGILHICGASSSLCAISDIVRSVSGVIPSEDGGSCVDAVEERTRLEDNSSNEHPSDSEWWIRAQSRLIKMWRYATTSLPPTEQRPSLPCSSCSLPVSVVLFDVPNRYVKMDSTFNISRRIGMYSFDAVSKRKRRQQELQKKKQRQTYENDDEEQYY